MTERTHEVWLHFVKSPRYFAAVDEIREPHHAPNAHSSATGYAFTTRGDPNGEARAEGWIGKARTENPLGKLPGSVWNLTYWECVDRIERGWAPSGICSECGEGRSPVVDKHQIPVNKGTIGKGRLESGGGRVDYYAQGKTRYNDGATITGYACACTPYTDHPGTGTIRGERFQEGRRDAVGGGRWDHDPPATRNGPRREYHLVDWTPPDTKPAVILDVFGGTGTVAMVARALGRTGISVDLSHDYSRLAKWRIFESGHAAKAMSKTNLERQMTL